MIRAKRTLFMLMAPFFLFILTGCPDHDLTITEKSYKFIKSVEKKEFFQGEKIRIDLVVSNKTGYDVKSLKILKETNPKGYRAIGSDFTESGEIYRRNGKVLTYGVVANSPGNIVISPSKIKEVVVKWPAGKIIAPEDIGFSNSIKIKVKPLRLKIHQTVRKTKIRVGGKIRIDLLVENDNDLDVEDMEILFGGDTSGLRLLSSERISLRRWEHKKIRLVFLALQAGEIELRQATINQLKFNDAWTCSEKNYGVSNPAPKITVPPVRLPGLEYPLRYYTKEIKNYFSLFILKILGIATLLILIIRIFTAVLYSRLVENLFFRIYLVFLIVWVAEALGIFLVCGGMEFFKSTPPDLWEIAMIISCSCGFVLFLGPPLFKNAFFNSFLVGVLLSLSAYFFFLGFKSFDLNEFINFPVREAVFFGLTGGIFLNAIFLRKNFKRR